MLIMLLSGCFRLPPNPCRSKNGGCGLHAVCTLSAQNTPVCSCAPGFSGDGHTCVVSCADLCDSSMSQCGCSAKAACLGDADGGRSCQCGPGFVGDGFSCAPIQQPACTMTCDPNATCQTDSAGDARCVCNPGFTGNGLSCTRSSGIGAACADSTAGQQSTCDVNLSCRPISAMNMCTRVCARDADCAGETINGLASVCNGGLCFPSCDGSGCGRTDMICNTATLDHFICLPDCRVQEASFCDDFFGYPFQQCDSRNGSCLDETPCDARNPCGADETCFATTFDSAAASVCVLECTVPTATTCSRNTDCQLGACLSGVCQSCPFGTSCDETTTLTCLPVPVGNYGACSSQTQCPASDLCVAFAQPPVAGPPTASLCLQACTTDAQCPTGQGCAIPLASGETVCALPCSPGTTCPTGTSCKSLQTSGALCLP